MWFVSLFTASYATMATVKSYSYLKEYTTVSDYAIAEDEIFIKEIEEKTPEKFFGILTSDLRINHEGIKIGNVRIKTAVYDDHLVRVERKISGRGADEKDAIRNIEAVDNQFIVEGNVLKSSAFLTIPENAKFRGQQVTYTVYVPKGKKVSFSGNRLQRGPALEILGEDSDIEDYLENSFGEGSRTEGAENFTTALSEESLPISGHHKIVISGPWKVVISKGKSPDVKVSGSEDFKKQVTVKADDNTLNISYPESMAGNDATIQIITEDLSMVSLYDVQSAEITGFSIEKLKLISHVTNQEYVTKIDVKADIRFLDLSADGLQDISINGKGEQAEIHLSGGSMLSAKSFTVKKAVVYGQDYKPSELTVTGTVNMPDGINPAFSFSGSPKITGK